ncbi:MAG: prephenate dehydratase [Nitrospirae bacterium]|nr:prephenate dehydratase [Nitrospirota bacterium]
MDALKDLRDRIDSIDENVLRLLNQRANIAVEIAKVKKEQNLDYYSPKREQEIMDNLQRLNKGPFPNYALRIIFKEIFCASLSLEQPVSVAYLGPPATYTHQAALKYFSSSCKFMSVHSIREVFVAVDSEKAAFGVVPIENSTEGAVNYTLDMFIDFNLKVYAEILLAIEHNLLSRASCKEEITKVYSHPQPLAQCREWLERNMLGIPMVEALSTSLAAKLATEEEGAAAIGSELAGKLYELNFIERNIESIKDNVTRFLIISKKSPDRSGDDKTLIMFTVKDEPGALHEILKPFKRQKINLTRIESRPSKKKAWEYIFFADIEGHIEDRRVNKALSQVKKNSVLFKILGSYPHVENIER